MANGIGGRRGQCRLTKDNIELLEFGEVLALRKPLGKHLSAVVVPTDRLSPGKCNQNEAIRTVLLENRVLRPKLEE